MGRLLSVELELPWPVGINGHYTAIMHRGAKHPRLVLSAKSRAYNVDVRRACIKGLGSFLGWPCRPAFGESRLSVQIITHQPTKAKTDLDGRLKSLLDALTYSAAWVDDSQIDTLHVIRGTVAPKRDAACVVVRISELVDYDSLPFRNAKDLTK